MLKKTMALVLTLVMTTALAVPMVALASSAYGSGEYVSASSGEAEGLSSGAQQGKYKLTYDTKTDVPTLNLTITGGGGIVMNPYGIARDTTNFVLEGGSGSDKAQIISTQLKVESKTTLPVKIGATVQAVVSPANTNKPIKLVAKVNKDKDTTKNVSLYLAAAKDNTDVRKTFDTYPTADVSGDNTKAGIMRVTSAYDSNSKKGAVTKADFYTLEESNGTVPKSCVLQFFGEMVPEPKDDPWQPNDKIQPTVILDFQLKKTT